MSLRSTFSIRPATADDALAAGVLHTVSFGEMAIEAAMGNTTDPTDQAACGARHLRAWEMHKAETGQWPAIVCVSTDPSSGKETVVALAEWFIWMGTASTDESVNGARYVLSGSWVQDEAVRAEVAQAFRQTWEKRSRWGEGRGIGILMYMCTAPEFRRQGAATLCVRWGMEKCAELGVPALLEASDMGKPVYAALGFEEVDRINLDIGGNHMDFPVMLRWPPGTKEEDKRVL